MGGLGGRGLCQKKSRQMKRTQIEKEEKLVEERWPKSNSSNCLKAVALCLKFGPYFSEIVKLSMEYICLRKIWQ